MADPLGLRADDIDLEAAIEVAGSFDLDPEFAQDILSSAFFPEMLSRLGDFPETMEFFGLIHRSVQLDIMDSAWPHPLQMECYIPGSGYADLCEPFAWVENAGSFAVAEVKPNTVFSINAGRAQLASRLANAPGAVLAPGKVFPQRWPRRGSVDGLAGFVGNLMGVKVDWRRMEAGLYTYNFTSGLPTALAWREARAKVRQVVANYQASLLPPAAYVPPQGSIGFAFNLETEQALLLGLTAAAAAGVLIVGAGGASLPTPSSSR